MKYIPKRIQSGLSSATWSLDSGEGICLTFDDGPTEFSTEILDILATHNTKASFFLLGSQAEKYPDVVKRMREEGHAIGNHGYLHLDGWRTSFDEYCENVAKGKSVLNTTLYRPPYGRMTPKQWKRIAETERIIMWDVMPGDFDPRVSAEKCESRLLSYVREGSIIVLHDNATSRKTVTTILPRLLTSLKEKGLRMKPLF